MPTILSHPAVALQLQSVWLPRAAAGAVGWGLRLRKDVADVDGETREEG